MERSILRRWLGCVRSFQILLRPPCNVLVDPLRQDPTMRRGASFRWVRRIRDRPRKPAGKFRTMLRGWSDRMFGLLGESRWGVAIVFLSACVYVPPLYAV